MIDRQIMMNNWMTDKRINECKQTMMYVCLSTAMWHENKSNLRFCNQILSKNEGNKIHWMHFKLICGVLLQFW